MVKVVTKGGAAVDEYVPNSSAYRYFQAFLKILEYSRIV